jgi:hypothetical protein
MGERTPSDREGCALVLDVNIDIAIKVSDIQEPFEVIRGYITLLLEAGNHGFLGSLFGYFGL